MCHKWSQEDLQRLRLEVENMGTCWKEIQQGSFRDRKVSEVKSKYYSLMKKKKQIKPSEAQQLVGLLEHFMSE